jgi:hypothetical protein
VEATVERRIDRVVALAIDLFSSVSLPVADVDGEGADVLLLIM